MTDAKTPTDTSAGKPDAPYYSERDPAVIAARAQAAKVAAEGAPLRGKAWIPRAIAIVLIVGTATAAVIAYKRFSAAPPPAPVVQVSAPIPTTTAVRPVEPAPPHVTTPSPESGPPPILPQFAAGPELQRALIGLDATMNLVEGQEGPMNPAKQRSIALAIVKVADAAKGATLSPSDQLAVMNAAAKAGIAPSGGTVAECMGAAKFVAQQAQSPAQPLPAQTQMESQPKAPAATPAAGDAKPKLELTPGALARIFVLTDGTFPPKIWPEAPVATITLPAIPDVKPQWVIEEGRDVPNRILQHPALTAGGGVFFYAIEFESFIRVDNDGPTVFSVTSDDPVVVSIDDQQVIRSDWSLDPSQWVVADTMGKFQWRPQMQKTVTSIGTVSLQAGKAYRLTARSVQRWRPDAFIGRERFRADGVRWRDDEQGRLAQNLTPITCGATFLMRMTPPGAAEAAPIDAYIVKRERSKREE